MITSFRCIVFCIPVFNFTRKLLNTCFIVITWRWLGQYLCRSCIIYALSRPSTSPSMSMSIFTSCWFCYLFNVSGMSVPVWDIWFIKISASLCLENMIWFHINITKTIDIFHVDLSITAYVRCGKGKSHLCSQYTCSAAYFDLVYLSMSLNGSESQPWCGDLFIWSMFHGVLKNNIQWESPRKTFPPTITAQREWH